jgi:hypothetical protein
MKASSFSELYATLCFFFNSDSQNIFPIAVLSYHTIPYPGTSAIFLVVLVPAFVANSRVVLDSLMFVTIFGLPNKLSIDPLSNRMLSSLVLDAHCIPLLCRLSFFTIIGYSILSVYRSCLTSAKLGLRCCCHLFLRILFPIWLGHASLLFLLPIRLLSGYPSPDIYLSSDLSSCNSIMLLSSTLLG